MHRWKGIEEPFVAPSLQSAPRLAVRASARPRQRKSKRAVTRDVLNRPDSHLRDRSARRCRDLAILLLAFASGGTRRSEVARLRVEQLGDEPPARLDPHAPKSPALPCLAIQLGRTKTGDADEKGRVLLVGPPVGRFTNGWSGPTSRRGRSSGRSTAGSGGRERAHAAVDQSDR